MWPHPRNCTVGIAGVSAKSSVQSTHVPSAPRVCRGCSKRSSCAGGTMRLRTRRRLRSWASSCSALVLSASNVRVYCRMPTSICMLASPAWQARSMVAFWSALYTPQAVEGRAATSRLATSTLLHHSQIGVNGPDGTCGSFPRSAIVVATSALTPC